MNIIMDLNVNFKMLYMNLFKSHGRETTQKYIKVDETHVRGENMD